MSREELQILRSSVCRKDPQHVMTDFLTQHPVVKSFVVGSISGTCSSILFQPLDLVKTRLQTPYAIGGLGPAADSGMMTLVGHIVKHERVFGLWRGMTPTLTRCVPGVGLYFASLDWLKARFTDKEKGPGPLAAVALGMTARTMSGVCMIPITVVKTRYESGVYEYRGIWEALRTIYRTEGVRGLCCGLTPTLIRDAPFSGIYLMFYTQTKKIVPPKWLDSSASATLHFTCGIIAGLMASVVTQPADVIKTKMQLYPDRFDRVHQVVIYVYKKYGATGYFRGLVPRMLRRTLMAAMAWTVYEQITKNIGLK